MKCKHELRTNQKIEKKNTKNEWQHGRYCLPKHCPNTPKMNIMIEQKKKETNTSAGFIELPNRAMMHLPLTRYWGYISMYFDFNVQWCFTWMLDP